MTTDLADVIPPKRKLSVKATGMARAADAASTPDRASSAHSPSSLDSLDRTRRARAQAGRRAGVGTRNQGSRDCSAEGSSAAQAGALFLAAGSLAHRALP